MAEHIWFRCCRCSYTANLTDTGLWRDHFARAHGDEEIAYTAKTYDSVVELMRDTAAPTAKLEDFVREYEADDNNWWRISCGHHQNLFDMALERIEDLEGILAMVKTQAGDNPVIAKILS